MDSTETPNQLGDIRYAAWVPTIMGHLSYSLIGQSGNKWHYANSEKLLPGRVAAPRLVAVTTRRRAEDFIYSGWPITAIFPSIAAEYFLLGETCDALTPKFDRQGNLRPTVDQFGVLSGKVFFIPIDQRKTHSASRRIGIRKLRRRLAIFHDENPRDAPGDTTSLRAELENVIEWMRDHDVLCYGGQFNLFRTGELRMTFSSEPLFMNGKQVDPVKLEAIHRQLYYFIKEAAHRHYHHPRQADNMLPLTSVTTNDDETWRRETLWSLTRSVLQVRRRDRLIDYKSALGILSYADAFQSTLARVRRLNGTFSLAHDIATYDFVHARQSFEAKIDELKFQNSGWSSCWVAIPTVVIAATALWFGAAQIVIAPKVGHGCGLECAGLSSSGQSFIEFTARNPRITFSIIGLGTSIYLAYSQHILRLTTATRGLQSFGLEFFISLGALISKGFRKVNIYWGDRIANLLIIALLSLSAALTLDGFFSALLARKGHTMLSLYMAPILWIYDLVVHQKWR